MPTIYEEAGFRFSFVSADNIEPPHVHVEGSSGAAKIWLKNVQLEWSRGLTRLEVKRIINIVRTNQKLMLDAWNDYFGE